MKRVRGFYNHTEGSHTRLVDVGIVEADKISPEDIQDMEFRCFNPKCRAEFNWVRGYHRAENSQKIKPTFTCVSLSQHRKDCEYKYVPEEKTKREYKLLQPDGKYHVRINFPLGSHPGRDIHVRVSEAQYAKAENNTRKIIVSSMKNLIKLLEREFDTLDNPELDKLVVHYQGHEYPWQSLWTPAEKYGQLYDAVRNSNQTSADEIAWPLIALLRIAGRDGTTDKGKPRFECERTLAVNGDGKTQTIYPKIVCASEEVAANLTQGQVVVVGMRPLIPKAVMNNERRADSVPVTVYVDQARQMAQVRDEYWRPVRAGVQTSLRLRRDL